MQSVEVGDKVCQTTGGGKIVGIPGFPGEKIDQRLLNDIKYLRRKYKIFITDGYSTDPVHSANGEHPRGVAMDIVPNFAAGGDWNDIDRLAKMAEPNQNQPRSPFRWVGYNGDSGHGRGTSPPPLVQPLRLGVRQDAEDRLHPPLPQVRRGGGGGEPDRGDGKGGGDNDGPAGGITQDGGGGDGGRRWRLRRRRRRWHLPSRLRPAPARTGRTRDLRRRRLAPLTPSQTSDAPPYRGSIGTFAPFSGMDRAGPPSKAVSRAFPSWLAPVRPIRVAYSLPLKAASFRT